VDSVKPQFYRKAGDILRAADKSNDGMLLHDRIALQYFRETWLSQHRLFGADFREALKRSPGAKVISAVESANDIPRQNFAVFIPPTDQTFWDFQATCRDKHNIQVSLTGQPSLLGGVPLSYGCARDAYQANYGSHFDAHDIGDADLCTHARERHILDVFILTDLSHPEANRTLHCGDGVPSLAKQ
jgi:hypothetical protein